ncbi:uncharacterized protein CEXT_283812 [Caerostris extrusa]|uniref:Uncharacterized protein n=1 Tax=Caerostris extrusa TaxID=172846 RepID=A0AAV4NMI2_CAEEX|nr:uncharacterized protein CEXT_283812 [Caerostris extrusa]
MQINDSFARLEEQADIILSQLESLRAAQERYEKEARANFKKILDVNSMLEKLGATKADRAEMMKLLDLKADLELVMTKLDRSEFIAVVQDLEESIERLSIQVKNERRRDAGGLRRPPQGAELQDVYGGLHHRHGANQEQDQGHPLRAAEDQRHSAAELLPRRAGCQQVCLHLARFLLKFQNSEYSNFIFQGFYQTVCKNNLRATIVIILGNMGHLLYG